MPTESYSAWAAHAQAGELTQIEMPAKTPELGQVEIQVEHCGICHSDLSFLDGDWGAPPLPFIPGHEAIGRITAVGAGVDESRIGERVGLGYQAASCMTCGECMDGDHHLCLKSQPTIAAQPGGFADYVFAASSHAVALPDALDPVAAGPLYCGGVTVFSPFIEFDVKPLDHVAVVGIGGLGHLALQFAKAWGCEVTAISNSPDKEAEARAMGAHHFVIGSDADALKKNRNQYDLIIVTINQPIVMNHYVNMLKPKGRLHFVGMVVEPVQVTPAVMTMGQKSISSSPIGSPSTIAKMVKFAARHDVKPEIEVFNFGDVNDAMERLRNGSPRFRVVVTHGN